LSGGRCQRHCHRTWTLERDVRVCTRDPRRGNRWRLARGAIRRGCRRGFPHTTDTERGRTMVQVLQAGIHNAIRLLFVSRWRRGCIGEVCAGARGAAGWIHGNGAVPRRRSRISLSNSAPGWAAAAKRASSGRGRIWRGGGCETLTWYFVLRSGTAPGSSDKKNGVGTRLFKSPTEPGWNLEGWPRTAGCMLARAGSWRPWTFN
jgi:hypothetical protein